MYGLSIKQPWASLILSGLKTVENRTWKFNEKYINQDIIVCSSKKFDTNYNEIEMVNIDINHPDYQLIINESKNKLGLALGIIQFTGIVDSNDDWACFNCYAYKLKVIEVFDNPYPIKGQLGFFKV